MKASGSTDKPDFNIGLLKAKLDSMPGAAQLEACHKHRGYIPRSQVLTDQGLLSMLHSKADAILAQRKNDKGSVDPSLLEPNKLTVFGCEQEDLKGSFIVATPSDTGSNRVRSLMFYPGKKGEANGSLAAYAEGHVDAKENHSLLINNQGSFVSITGGDQASNSQVPMCRLANEPKFMGDLVGQILTDFGEVKKNCFDKENWRDWLENVPFLQQLNARLRGLSYMFWYAQRSIPSPEGLVKNGGISAILSHVGERRFMLNRDPGQGLTQLSIPVNLEYPGLVSHIVAKPPAKPPAESQAEPGSAGVIPMAKFRFDQDNQSQVVELKGRKLTFLDSGRNMKQTIEGLDEL